MPIDFWQVPWQFVGLMTAFAFFAAILGSLISFRNKFVGAIIAGVLFGLFFIGWNFYPHQTFGLPYLDKSGVKTDGNAG
jgi:hypothetical protein